MYLNIEKSLRTPEPFLRWLQAQPDGEVVGDPAKPDTCPIANFINSEFMRGTEYVCISKIGLTAYDKTHMTYRPIIYGDDLPQWVLEYMWWVDRQPGKITKEVAMFGTYGFFLNQPVVESVS